MTKPYYLNELQGLRGLAVISVFFYHATPELLPGGFVGVDIFLVLSGYLITGILIKNDCIGFKDLKDFYTKRFRRLYPTLLVCILAVLIFSFILLPDEQVDLANSSIFALLSLSNVYFWKTAGYFDTMAAFKPLVHTWSLAVEWQFYLIYPLVFFISSNRRWLFTILCLGCGISFLISTYAAIYYPVPNYYLPISRAWEFGAGALCHFVRFRNLGNLDRFLIWLCTLVLIISVIFINDKTLYPGWATLPVILATCIYIKRVRSVSLITKILISPTLVFIGNISYSFYLFHQPILAYARHLGFDPTSFVPFCIILVLSILISKLSFNLIEVPFNKSKLEKNQRYKQKFFYSTLFFIALLLSLIIIKDGFPNRIKLYEEIPYRSLGHKISKIGVACKITKVSGFENLDLCIGGDVNSNKIIVAYGDSHLESLQWAISEFATRKRFKVIFSEIKGCGVIIDISAAKGNFDPQKYWKKCNNGLRQLKKLISDSHANVIIASRWTYQFYPTENITSLAFDNTVGGIEIDLPYRQFRAITPDIMLSYEWEAKRAALRKLVAEIGDVSGRVIIVGPIPEIGWDIFKENLSYYKKHQELITELKFPKAIYLQRNNMVMSALREFTSEHSNMRYVEPDSVFCDEFCFAQKNQIPLYVDDDHLSDAGAQLLVEKIFSQFENW